MSNARRVTKSVSRVAAVITVVLVSVWLWSGWKSACAKVSWFHFGILEMGGVTLDSFYEGEEKPDPFRPSGSRGFVICWLPKEDSRTPPKAGRVFVPLWPAVAAAGFVSVIAGMYRPKRG